MSATAILVQRAAAAIVRNTERAAERVLPSHLPSAELSRLTNPLYRARGLKANHLIWYWQSAGERFRPEWIVLAAHDARIQVALYGDAVGLDDDATERNARLLDWRSYADETRLLAWTARHERLIELLRIVFQRDWTPESFHYAEKLTPPAQAGFIRAGFSIYQADGPCVVSGVVEFDAACIEHIVARMDFAERRFNRPAQKLWAKLPLVLDELDLDPAELSDITRGCIVRLDNRTLLSQGSRIVIPAGRVSLVAEVTDTRATVVSFASPALCRGGTLMNDDRTMDSDRRVEIESLPVRLSFHAGSLTLPFGALCDVAPGYVFDLPKRLDDQVITIHANDTPIAVGELVVIGDLVGVRITRMLPSA